MLEQELASYAMKIAIIATILLIFWVLLSLILHSHKVKFNKTLMFVVILLTVLLPTLFFISSTVYLNTISESKGPVHWHADIEIFACGTEINLRDPKGFSNKIGTAVLHEHNDKRIHQEGVVVHRSDVSLSNFFSVIGGMLSHYELRVPVNEGIKTFTNGESCPDGSMAEVQVFRYGAKDGVYYQEKLTDFPSFVMAPYSAVPEGDCLVVEFDMPKESTDKLCRSYQVAEEIGKLKKAF